ncbi:MAG: RluA family pseudouridine synthase [Lachnospiraceae bacterium]|nr:RluA family pseudouridine synthase [Lachnospiraceae bacterium]
MKEFVISEKEYGQRLDKYLFKVLDRAPGGFIYKMLRKKNIVLNDRKATGKEIIQENDHVRIYLSDETFAKFASLLPDASAGHSEADSPPRSKSYPAFSSGDPGALSEGVSERLAAGKTPAIDIVYEDADILVINKPAGLLSQKASPGDDSANDRILSYLLSSGQLTEAELRTFHPSICNRLDRNTSGLLIAGKTMRGLQQMGEQLKDRSVQKYYRTLVWGRVDEPRHLSGYLVKDHRTNRVEVTPVVSCADAAKTESCSDVGQREPHVDVSQTQPPSDDVQTDSLPAASRIETAYRPVDYFGNATLLEVHLITGRSHQIRAHLASVGHPVLGDAKYGDASVNRRLYRATGVRGQLLHACRMELADGRILEAGEPDTFRRAERWLSKASD